MVSALALPLAIVTATSAAASNEALTGSNFEIDLDANLKLDGAAPLVDWGTLAHPDDGSGPEIRAYDAETGQNDDSYKGGVKEDTECPGEVTGSIPNNKSDLLTFHFYEEAGTATHPGFINIAWSRVSDPSGTTLMDFEFNQSDTACTDGPNVVRTDGDLLIEYAIDQGGARAEITGRFWNATAHAWGPANDLDDGTGCGGGPCAVGTINTTVIPDADSDGLGEKQPRTFGEAQIDLRLLFSEDECTSFGSAMIKSRSSDSFTSQLKDFISPIPIEVTNCDSTTTTKPVKSNGAGGYTDINPGTVLVGTTVYDSAEVEVTGVSQVPPSGSVSFWICKLTSPELCDGTVGPADPDLIDNVGTSVGTTNIPAGNTDNPVTVVSPGYTVLSVGRYCFRAEYSGDTDAGIPGSKDFAATECFTVVSVPSSVTTAQKWYPNDSATISASAGGNLNGTVTFKLWLGDTCNSGGTALYTENKTITNGNPAGAVVSTTNYPDPAVPGKTVYAVTATGSTTFSWSVEYDSTNAAQDDIAKTCKEVSTLNINNNYTPAP